MNRYLLYILLIIIGFSCSEERAEEIVIIEEASYLTISASTITFENEAGSQSIEIESNSDWFVSSKLPEWLSFESYENSIILFVKQNETTEERRCTITISTDTDERSISIRQKAVEELYFKGEKQYSIPFEGGNISIEIESNISFDIDITNNDDEWVSHKGSSIFPNLGNNVSNNAFNSDNLELTIQANNSTNLREAKVIIENKKYELSDTISIIQEGNEKTQENPEKYTDGEYYKILQATHGNANLIFMGDGFTKKDLGKGGLYEQSINKAISHFFSIEPYKSYKEYFNAYMVIAESPSEGIGEKGTLGLTNSSNKFGTAFGSGTEIVCNDELIFEYAYKVSEVSNKQPITIIVVLNSKKYAGTAYLYNNGNAIALCPMSAEEAPNDFEGLIHHEAGGHAFGFLCDEYVYYEKEMPKSRISDIKEWQKYGFQMNLDFTNNTSEILWKDFIGVEKYENMVGAYEGGYEYRYGVWRSEENSCMNNNVPYYNVQSRWTIAKRIMELSGKDYSIEEFIAQDNPEPLNTTTTRNVSMDYFTPLGEPVWIKVK